MDDHKETKEERMARIKSRNRQTGDYERGQVVHINDHAFRVTRWDPSKHKLILKRIEGEMKNVNVFVPTEPRLPAPPLNIGVASPIKVEPEPQAPSNPPTQATDVAVYPNGTPGLDSNCVVTDIEPVKSETVQGAIEQVAENIAVSETAKKVEQAIKDAPKDCTGCGHYSHDYESDMEDCDRPEGEPCPRGIDGMLPDAESEEEHPDG